MYDNHRDRWHTKAAFRDRMAPAALRVHACPSERTSPEGDRIGFDRRCRNGCQFLPEFFPATPVPPIHDLVQKCLVSRPVFKIPAAAENHLRFNGSLESMVRLFGVTVLVSPPGLL